MPGLVLRRRDRRHKLQICFDILSAIERTMYEGGARPTRIQHLSNLSYDGLQRYLNELLEKRMINKTSIISLTEKGYEFLRNYERIKELDEDVGGEIISQKYMIQTR